MAQTGQKHFYSLANWIAAISQFFVTFLKVCFLGACFPSIFYFSFFYFWILMKCNCMMQFHKFYLGFEKFNVLYQQLEGNSRDWFNRILNSIRPSTGHKESIGMPTLHIGPLGSEELRPKVKGFTFIVIVDMGPSFAK